MSLDVSKVKKSICILFLIMMLMMVVLGCESSNETKAYEEVPQGILIDQVPETMDIVFSSIRGVINNEVFYKKGKLIENFIENPECNALIYDTEAGQLAVMKQIYMMDYETREVIQVTNLEMIFSDAHAIDPVTLIATAIDEDTDGNGKINDEDAPQLCLVHLDTKEVEWLTKELNLNSINNMDYSVENELILFSAQPSNEFHNYLYTLSLTGSLNQIAQEGYMGFDCSWSASGEWIVYVGFPEQAYPYTIPSEIWMMDAEGNHMKQITTGGLNLDDEEPHGPYPIGVDIDPHLNADNIKVVFSRLITGTKNQPFGNYALLEIDLESDKITEIIPNDANMLPVWDREGIYFIQQIGTRPTNSQLNAMEVLQYLALYKDGETIALEEYPYNVFPLGAYSLSVIDYHNKVYTNKDRLSHIAEDVKKGTPDNDPYPPKLYSNEFEEAIPLESQILAVADSFDAMTIDRVYQKAKTISEALEELISMTPNKYNVEVVNTLESIIESNEI